MKNLKRMTVAQLEAEMEASRNRTLDEIAVMYKDYIKARPKKTRERNFLRI